MRPYLMLALLLAILSVERCASLAADAKRNQLVRVVTLSQDKLAEAAGKPLLDATLAILDRAASFQPDIVCLPETFTRDVPEAVPGPTTDRLSRWAQEHSCYVICPITTQVGERVFNSAVLLDRKGRVVGRYDKIRPTEGELERNICPGSPDPPLFETDFGLIGVQICFDVNWHDQWRGLKERGARIIFFPSAYPASRQLKSHAWLNQCFIVSATKSGAASVYDITGDVLETTGKYRPWAGAVLPVGKRLFEVDYHVAKIREIEKRYGDKVSVSWYHDDDLVTLASLDPDLTVDHLIDEFDLTPHVDYIQRAQKAQAEGRQSTKLPRADEQP